jgi:ribokinase
VNLPRLVGRGLNGGGFRMTLRAFMAAVGSLGPHYVLLTDGLDGAYLGTREELLFCPALKVPVAGTAGAGDAFTSTFATFIALGGKPEHALQAATVNAASVVSHVDTQTGLLQRTEIEDRVAARVGEMAVQRWEFSRETPVARRSDKKRA